MNPTFSSDFAPQFVFFFSFFVAFSLVELLLIFVLNRLSRKYWEFVIDHIIRVKVHYGRVFEVAAIFGIVALLILVYFRTPFFTVIQSTTPVLKVFAVLQLLIMVLIYFTTTRKFTHLALERKVHQYMYFVVSLILFVFIIILADDSYTAYRKFINTQFVTPAVENIQTQIDEQKKESLLKKFSGDLAAGKCSSFDYTQQKGPGLTHFVFVAFDPALAEPSAAPLGQGMPSLKGKVCTDGVDSFLITEQGQWYWVISNKNL